MIEGVYISEIRAFGCNYAPRYWAECNGQILRISDYEPLFALLGTMYGGDGRTTFGLPDLRGRNMVHQGSGPGLPPFQMGQKGGSEKVGLASEGASVDRSPYQVVNFCIALDGIFPPRS